jgi:site-specific recombinase XerD
MLRHTCGYALANKGHDTRAIQAWLERASSLIAVKGEQSISRLLDCY